MLINADKRVFIGAAFPAFRSSPPPPLLASLVGRGPGYLLQSGPLGVHKSIRATGSAI